MNRLRSYGIMGLFKLIVSKLNTMIFFSNSRIIRLPYFIRGQRYIDFGEGLTTGRCIRLDAFPIQDCKRKILINFGNNVQVNDYVHIAAIDYVEIGNNVLIASKVFITDHNHGSYGGVENSSPEEFPSIRKLMSDPVIIEDNVWIGEFVSVLPGVRIGYGAIIGSNSVVSHSIPPNTICVGVPAKPIKVYDNKSGKWEKISD
ncbi:hypothetical protein [Jiulongibacter sp. NS-SX5]|uniref:hypothetical protein n=1 Tax=Jiulongibacter sp. NS-SX5 TaxID=3463854 RepID=UPI004058813E